MKHLPNLLTVMNLLLGVAGIYLYAVSPANVALFPLLLGGSLILDLLDGLVARALHVQSSMGAQLDSLADMVSFGVQPAVALALVLQDPMWAAGLLLFPACAAWRLAVFNTDPRQSLSFRGLASPAAAVAVLGLLYYTAGLPQPLVVWSDPVIVGLAAVFAVLMVAPLPMFSFKLKHARWRGNQGRYVLVAVAAAAFAYFGPMALPWVVLFYVFLSLTLGPQEA